MINITKQEKELSEYAIELLTTDRMCPKCLKAFKTKQLLIDHFLYSNCYTTEELENPDLDEDNDY